MACAVCTYADSFGWWGTSIPSGHTHCRTCHRTFKTGFHCLGCHDHFSSNTTFDMHQRSGGCRTLADLLYECEAHRYRQVVMASGPTWRGTLHAEVCKNWGLCGTNGRNRSRAEAPEPHSLVPARDTFPVVS